MTSHDLPEDAVSTVRRVDWNQGSGAESDTILAWDTHASEPCLYDHFCFTLRYFAKFGCAERNASAFSFVTISVGSRIFFSVGILPFKMSAANSIAFGPGWG